MRQVQQHILWSYQNKTKKVYVGPLILNTVKKILNSKLLSMQEYQNTRIFLQRATI